MGKCHVWVLGTPKTLNPSSSAAIPTPPRLRLLRLRVDLIRSINACNPLPKLAGCLRFDLIGNGLTANESRVRVQCGLHPTPRRCDTGEEATVWHIDGRALELDHCPSSGISCSLCNLRDGRASTSSIVDAPLSLPTAAACASFVTDGAPSIDKPAKST